MLDVASVGYLQNLSFYLGHYNACKNAKIIIHYIYFKAGFIKEDETLFIIFNCSFSSLCVIFLVSGSRW